MSAPLPDWLCISEVDHGAFFAAPLFRRKFGGDPPVQGHHLVAFYQRRPMVAQTLCYAHFMPFGDIVLVGGVCTDGEVIRAMPDGHRAQLGALGGAYYQVLRYGFARFAADCEAYFGYCGDARAEVVNLQAGFEKTGHPHLLVHWHREQHPVMQRALLAKAAAIGPF